MASSYAEQQIVQQEYESGDRVALPDGVYFVTPGTYWY